MPVTISCSGCQQTLKAPDSFVGRTVRCPRCKQPVRVTSNPVKSTMQPAAPESNEGSPSSLFSGLDTTAQSHANPATPGRGRKPGGHGMLLLVLGVTGGLVVLGAIATIGVIWAARSNGADGEARSVQAKPTVKTDPTSNDEPNRDQERERQRKAEELRRQKEREEQEGRKAEALRKQQEQEAERGKAEELRLRQERYRVQRTKLLTDLDEESKTEVAKTMKEIETRERAIADLDQKIVRLEPPTASRAGWSTVSRSSKELSSTRVPSRSTKHCRNSGMTPRVNGPPPTRNEQTRLPSSNKNDGGSS